MSDTRQLVIERLPFLMGWLSGPEQVHATARAPATTALATVHGVGELDGALLVQRQRQEREGNVVFQAVNVFSLDTGTGEVLLYSFDSFGYPADPPARGRWHQADLVLERVTSRGASRTTYTPARGGYLWRKEFRLAPDQPWTRVVEGQMIATSFPSRPW